MADHFRAGDPPALHSLPPMPDWESLSVEDKMDFVMASQTSFMGHILTNLERAEQAVAAAHQHIAALWWGFAVALGLALWAWFR